MPSAEDLCNRALISIGSDSTINVIGENTVDGLLCQRLYEPARQTVLAAHIWNHAKKRARLSRLVATPPFKWAYYYALPSDYVRLAKIYDDADASCELKEYEEEAYEESGTQAKLVIATDAEQVYVEYIADTVMAKDVNRMPIHFRDSVVDELAKQLALVKTEHLSKYELMDRSAGRKIMQARATDTMNDAPLQIPWGPGIDSR